MADGLLSGLKVIDCATFIAAPLAATVFSDFGADVIKIEAPEGDGYRNLYNRPGAPESSTNYCWLMGGRNKRSIAIDLKTTEGIEILYRLVDEADVFITNLPHPARRRMKITAEDLLPRNDRLIYASFTAYGERGEEADKTGFDTTAYWARSGLMDQVRPDHLSQPARPTPTMGDHPSAMTLYAAVMTALYRRQMTGKGGHVSSSLLANGLWSNSFLVQARLVGASIPLRPPRDQSVSAMSNMYRTRDGRWFNLAMVNDVKQFPLLAAALGRPELATDERFATKAARIENVGEILAILDQLFGERDLADITATLEAAGITFGVVATLDEVVADQQMRAAEAIVPLADGSHETVNSPFQISGVTKTPPGAAPGIGQHTDEVLREYGFSDTEIRQFRSAKAVQ